MVMPYHLHMPSYFLETFTEYPCPTGTAGVTALRYSRFLLVKLLNIVQLQFVI